MTLLFALIASIVLLELVHINLVLQHPWPRYTVMTAQKVCLSRDTALLNRLIMSLVQDVPQEEESVSTVIGNYLRGGEHP